MSGHGDRQGHRVHLRLAGRACRGHLCEGAVHRL